MQRHHAAHRNHAHRASTAGAATAVRRLSATVTSEGDGCRIDNDLTAPLTRMSCPLIRRQTIATSTREKRAGTRQHTTRIGARVAMPRACMRERRRHSSSAREHDRAHEREGQIRAGWRERRPNIGDGRQRQAGQVWPAVERGRPAPLAAYAAPRHHPGVRAVSLSPGRAPTQLLTLRGGFSVEFLTYGRGS